MRIHQAISGALISTKLVSSSTSSGSLEQTSKTFKQVSKFKSDHVTGPTSSIDEEFTKYFKISVVYSKDLKVRFSYRRYIRGH